MKPPSFSFGPVPFPLKSCLSAAFSLMPSAPSCPPAPALIDPSESVIPHFPLSPRTPAEDTEYPSIPCFHDNLTGGALVEMLRGPSPTPSPGLLNWGEAGKESRRAGEWTEVRHWLSHPSTPAFFFFFSALNFYVEFSFHQTKTEIISLFCYCCATILLSLLPSL